MLWLRSKINPRRSVRMDENIPVNEMGPVEGIAILLVAIVITVVPFWRIFAKAGYTGWLSILMLIPLVNFILLYYLAFAKWPLQKEAEKKGETNVNLPPSS